MTKLKYFLMLLIMLTFATNIACANKKIKQKNSLYKQIVVGKSYDSWNRTFKKLLVETTKKYEQKKKITKVQLYELGRAYIRKKLEDELKIIEKEQLNTKSKHIILKFVFELLNYCNPSDLELSDDVPGFNPNLPHNIYLYNRWKKLSELALQNTVDNYDHGDKVQNDQLFELGRTILLTKMHKTSPISEQINITANQWIVLRSALHVINYLNVPAGPNFEYAPELDINKYPSKFKKNKWLMAETILKLNSATLGIGDGIIDFLTGSIYNRNVLSMQLKLDDNFKNNIIRIATITNMKLAQAAAAYTDINNKNVSLQDENSLFKNFIKGDEYALFLPPSIKVNYLKNINKISEYEPYKMPMHMKSFIKFGRIYGIKGWQGIGKKYLEKFNKQETKKTLKNFATYLFNEYVIFKKINLGKNKNNTLESYLKDASGEAKLGTFFSKKSVFAFF